MTYLALLSRCLSSRSLTFLYCENVYNRFTSLRWSFISLCWNEIWRLIYKIYKMTLIYVLMNKNDEKNIPSSWISNIIPLWSFRIKMQKIPLCLLLLLLFNFLHDVNWNFIRRFLFKSHTNSRCFNITEFGKKTIGLFIL